MPAAQWCSLTIGIVKGRNQANQNGKTGADHKCPQTDFINWAFRFG